MFLILIDLYSLVVIGAVIVSWMRLPRSHPIAGVIYTLTEPALAPIRRTLPAMGGLDFVSREEFDAVKDMAAMAREKVDILEARIAALEAKLADKG